MKTIFTSTEGRAAKSNFLSVVLLLLTTLGFGQYNVTEIVTDYGGYWKSSSATVNTVKPDNSHNLVSFSFNGNRYSTGVNDALLTSKGLGFIAGDYQALPVNSLGGTVTSNTKIGLGYMYDGNANGASNPAPLNNIPHYLTDGIKGLDLGTCVANLPAGTLNFAVSKIINGAINDGIPDVVITQIADPSGSSDRYEFTDINGTIVGNYVDINLTNIPVVGNWTADFYEASTNPMTLSGGYTKTDRPIRLWATDLSAFGINSVNSSQVAYFRIILSGNSDVAFVAYNNRSINIISTLLPVKLTNFTGTTFNNNIQLNWSVSDATNSAAFVLEKSTDGATFSTLENITVNSSAGVADYSFTDKNPAKGNNYYRLKMIDKDGSFAYSKVITVTAATYKNNDFGVYPNPASGYVIVNHPYAAGNEQLQIITLQGVTVLRQKIITGSLQTRIDLSGFTKGSYEMVWTNGQDVTSGKILLR